MRYYVIGEKERLVKQEGHRLFWLNDKKEWQEEPELMGYFIDGEVKEISEEEAEKKLV